jgi:hypothetical protein
MNSRTPDTDSRKKAGLKSLISRTHAAFGGLAMLLVALMLFSWSSFRTSDKHPPDFRETSGGKVTETGAAARGDMRVTNASKADDRIMIRRVLLTPPTPTKRDVLKAVVVPADDGPSGLHYLYEWKVNYRTVKKSDDNSLELFPFQVRDLVSVSVFPYDKDRQGFSVESPVAAIHSEPPTLSLEPARLPIRSGESIPLRMVGEDPDGMDITFSLEQPFVEGMIIDERSGEIIFTPSEDQKEGTIFFGAAVENSEGTKVTKIFELEMTLE